MAAVPATLPFNRTPTPSSRPLSLQTTTTPVKREASEESPSQYTHPTAAVSSPSGTSSSDTPHIKSESVESTPESDDSSDDLDLYIPVGVLRRLNAHENVDPTTAKSATILEKEVKKLENHNWIHTRSYAYPDNLDWCYKRVYVLPDDVGRKTISRSSELRTAFKTVMSKIDPSPEAWEGEFHEDNPSPVPDRAEDESLWYIFNTLQDPAPQVETMRDPYARRAMEELLDDTSSVAGLKTALYPYQRRSAATMLQREAQPALVLDPRLQTCHTPTGQEYYYDKEEGSIIREKRLYSEACGGILSETMGCGKTLICLALIKATSGHFPRIPVRYQQYENPNPVRPRTGSLAEMAASLAGRLSLPWKSCFDRLRRDGVVYRSCVEACETNGGAYTIPSPSTKYGGRSAAAFPRPPPRHIRLCAGTLVVTPPNLVDHWEHEVARHIEGLSVLVLRNYKDTIPSPDDLMRYDVVLFSRPRFEKEAGIFVHNRRASASQYDSPFLKLHWLRIIVDEGHNVAGSGTRTTMVHLLDQLCVDRRWSVSGTPSSGLYGVEVSLASNPDTNNMSLQEATSAALKRRKKTGSLADHELDDIDKLKYIVVNFLDLKPWSNSRAEDPANWTTYMKPIGRDGKRAKSASLRATLQSLVIRHRMDTIHSEVPLPKLDNRVVHLNPTFFDKLNLNLFIFILAVNAVTSERTDQDYMFHPRNRKHLSRTISNLRQAGFWWAGSEGDIAGTVGIAERYMLKNLSRMSTGDIGILAQGIELGKKALARKSWDAFRKYGELGISVEGFPSEAQSFWTLNRSNAQDEPPIMGISQALHAQKFVTSRLEAYDPSEGLSGAGIRTRSQLEDRGNHSGDAVKKTTPNKPADSKSPRKSYSLGLFKALPSESPLNRTRFVATASAKLTYLLDRVQELHQTEKIIIFYDNNNSAFWIAEGLELLSIDFRIYASTLRPEQRTSYLDLFRESEEVRVLLMDLGQAAHGLHIANASRMFFINPIWDPNIESQAIKRAHRIGQTRPVFAETLVLRNTLEDRMLQRRKNMSDIEIQHAERDLLDDSTMSSIIQNERFIPMEDDGQNLLASLNHQAGFFDRHTLPIPDPPAPKTPRKRKRVAIPSDDTTPPGAETLPKRRLVGGSFLDRITPIRSVFGGPSEASDSQQAGIEQESMELAPNSLLD